MSRGSSSGADGVFVLVQRDGKLFTREGQEVEVEAGCLRIPLYASDFGRYVFAPSSGEKIIFPYVREGETHRLITEAELREDYPKCYAYLREHAPILRNRRQARAWYAFSAARNLDLHASAHLMVPLLANRGLYCRLPDNMESYCPMASGGFTISLGACCSIAPEFLLGVLNSRLLYWKLANLSNVFRGGWITCTKQYFGQLPIRLLSLGDRREKERHDQIVSRVQTMLDLHKNLASAKTAHAKTAIQRQIDATDRQIDRLVYDLYGLTEDEIAIVEEAGEE